MEKSSDTKIQWQCLQQWYTVLFATLSPLDLIQRFDFFPKLKICIGANFTKLNGKKHVKFLWRFWMKEPSLVSFLSNSTFHFKIYVMSYSYFIYHSVRYQRSFPSRFSDLNFPLHILCKKDLKQKNSSIIFIHCFIWRKIAYWETWHYMSALLKLPLNLFYIKNQATFAFCVQCSNQA